jgi:hypothetical protein
MARIHGWVGTLVFWLAAEIVCPRVSAQIVQQPLPAKVEQLFQQAIASQPASKDRPDPRNANSAALQKLKVAPWPAVQSLQRARITTSGEKPAVQTVWLATATESPLTLLYDDFAIRPFPKDRVAKIEAVDYLAEIQALLAREETVGKRDYVIPVERWRDGYLDGRPSWPALWGDAVLVLHAYCALSRGHEAEGNKLLAAGLKRHPAAIDAIHQEWFWLSFQRGVELLAAGAPRKEVVQQWRQTLQGFPESRYTEQLNEYLPQLEAQLAGDEELAKSAVADPDSLPVEKRVAYYAARFPDVRGVQWSQPGHCQTFGMGERTTFSDAVIAIGLPAIPELIARLDDRRLTRSIGFHRSFSPHRIVLRVQDVAIQAIERIVSEPFYRVPTTSSYFSTEEGATRAKIVAEVKTWWSENGGKSPLEWHRSRLDAGSTYERIERLRKIVKLDPQAIDAVATLKGWAEQSSIEGKTEYATELAQRGDFSLLPEIRERALDRGKLPANAAIWYIARHGNASDFRILRETMLADRRRGDSVGNGSSHFGSIASGISSSKNPLAVPLLIDLLNERDGDYSLADRCFQPLAAITGHDAGYAPQSSRAERNAAIDRWIAWWKVEGDVAFLNKHPAVREVIDERPVKLDDLALAKLPALVSVAESSDALPVTYDVPRRSIPSLVSAGQVAVREDAHGQPTFRFTTPAAGLAWFDAVEPVAADNGVDRKLVPAMRVKTRGLTRPDSRGRVWCTWDRALSPIAAFDGRIWQTFVEPLPSGRIDNPVGFISAFPGADGAMVFQDRNHRFHVFDDAGHVRAASAAELLSRHAERLQRALPMAIQSSNAFYSHFVKDSQGRVWWSNWETDWGVVDGATVIRAADAIPAVAVGAGYRHELLFPAGDGRVLVFRDGNQSQGVLAELSNGKVTHVADLPFADVDRKQTGVMAVRDRLGRAWIVTRRGSRALDASGKLVAEHSGDILLQDRAGGLWFRVGGHRPDTALVRLSPDGQETALTLPRLRPFSPLAESPDGTFWAVAGNELVHIRVQADRLVEEARLPAPPSNYLWCDRDGRVWLVDGSAHAEQAVRLAVTKPNSAGRRD